MLGGKTWVLPKSLKEVVPYKAYIFSSKKLWVFLRAHPYVRDLERGEGGENPLRRTHRNVH